VVEDQGVEGDVALDAAGVERAHHRRQFFQREADFGAGGEVLEAEVDRVGAGFDGRAQLRPVAGGTHDFRFGQVTGHRFNSCRARCHLAPKVVGERKPGFRQALIRLGWRWTSIRRLHPQMTQICANSTPAICAICG
jgi:hypothetical protein